MNDKPNQRRRKPDPAVLADIVDRIVETAKPDRVVLFGSAARGEMGPDSDLDFLVIKAGKFDYWRMLTRIYRNLPGTEAVDVVLATPEQVEEHRDTHCLVICPALKEGKVVYESQASASSRPARMAQSSTKQPRLRKGSHS